jgi:hypothetical protein
LSDDVAVVDIDVVADLERLEYAGLEASDPGTACFLVIRIWRGYRLKGEEAKHVSNLDGDAPGGRLEGPNEADASLSFLAHEKEFGALGEGDPPPG